MWIKRYTLVIFFAGREERHVICEVPYGPYIEALRTGDCFDMDMMDTLSNWAGNFVEMLRENQEALGDKSTIGWRIDRESVLKVTRELNTPEPVAEYDINHDPRD